jgi:hypothetical protein
VFVVTLFVDFWETCFPHWFLNYVCNRFYEGLLPLYEIGPLLKNKPQFRLVVEFQVFSYYNWDRLIKLFYVIYSDARFVCYVPLKSKCLLNMNLKLVIFQLTSLLPIIFFFFYRPLNLFNFFLLNPVPESRLNHVKLTFLLVSHNRHKKLLTMAFVEHSIFPFFNTSLSFNVVISSKNIWEHSLALIFQIFLQLYI